MKYLDEEVSGAFLKLAQELADDMERDIDPNTPLIGLGKMLQDWEENLDIRSPEFLERT